MEVTRQCCWLQKFGLWRCNLFFFWGGGFALHCFFYSNFKLILDTRLKNNPYPKSRYRIENVLGHLWRTNAVKIPLCFLFCFSVRGDAANKGIIAIKKNVKLKLGSPALSDKSQTSLFMVHKDIFPDKDNILWRPFYCYSLVDSSLTDRIEGTIELSSACY